MEFNHEGIPVAVLKLNEDIRAGFDGDDAFMKRTRHNLSLPPLHVYHANLRGWGQMDSLFKRSCLCCFDGVLLLRRSGHAMELAEEDMCVQCGRRYVYLDIEELRLFERGKAPYPSPK
jgi:hypothetical protein